MAPQTKAVALTQKDNETMAMAVALSRSQAVPLEYIGKPDKVFAAVVMGRELGLGPMASLCNIFNVNGKPSMNVHVMLGKCMMHRDYAGWGIVKETPTSCEVEMFRWNDRAKKAFRYTGSWSKEEYLKAGLGKSGMYDKYPKNMYLARALTFVIRKAFPDVVTGLYSLEEMAPERYEEEVEEDMMQVEELAKGGRLDEESGKVEKGPKRKAVQVPKAQGTAKARNKLAPSK